jgi:hypothetical protein
MRKPKSEMPIYYAGAPRIPGMMMKPGCELPEFSERDIAITLPGRQWFTLLAKIVGCSLSVMGEKELREATAQLQAQLLDAT